HERWQRHRERRGELGHDGWGLSQPFHDGPPRRIRESAEHGVEYVVILRHRPNYYKSAGICQPGVWPLLRYLAGQGLLRFVPLELVIRAAALIVAALAVISIIGAARG
ncbi:MAG: hypothetical protein QOH29_497, partial [Actinomycetota bacterium]|nr:hypothetical protein [Actinomycetota bacterium]